MRKSAATANVRKRGSSKRPSAAGRPSSSVRRASVKVRASAGRSSSTRSGRPGGKKTVVEKELPRWLHCIALALMSLAAAGLVYLFLIRPYSYRWKPCYGSKEYEVCMPGGYGLYGIDVSHHQGEIDWSMVPVSRSVEFPLSFVFMKATEGHSFKDENFDVNLAGARAAGLACGAYLFYDPSDSPKSQAGFFIDNVSLKDGDLPPVVDVEKRSGNSIAFQRNLLSCLEILEQHFGVRPIIYASYKFRKNYLTLPEFGRYPFWVAHYYVDEPCSDGSSWDFWQFTDRGRVPGIRGNTDLNVFGGSQTEFGKLLVGAAKK